MSKKVTVQKKRTLGRVAKRLSLEEYPLVNFPFRVLLILGLFLVSATFLFLFRNMALEEQRLYEEIKSRADVLIWALEGGARSLQPGQPAPPPPPRIFVEEIASQPNVRFLAILDSEGRAVAHSDPSQNGNILWDKKDLEEFENTKISKGFLLCDEDGVHYDVIKEFTPSMHHMRKGMMHAPSPEMEELSKRKSSPYRESPPYYIIVSIDPGASITTLREHTFHLLAIACLLVLSSITGVALLIFIRNFNTSKKLLEDTKALALQVFDRLPIGVFTTDKEGYITLCNKASLHIVEQLNHANHINQLTWFDWQYFTQCVDAGLPIIEDEYDFLVKDEKLMTVGITAYALATSEPSKHQEYLFIVRDLGEVKRLQKQVRLNERLTALGNLAAGVAHEIRNPLSTIKGYATYLAEKLKNSQDHATAKLMLEEMERLNRVVSDLLTMAKNDKLELKKALLEPIVHRALRLAMPEAENKGVRIQSNISPHAMSVIDEDKILQALLNLLINAVHATPQGKQITITSAIEADSVVLRIHDEGHGIDAETLSKIFSPYFTTKPSGTGLGLTITHQIIEQHGGQIRVQSEKANGSTFTVILPLAKDSLNG